MEINEESKIEEEKQDMLKEISVTVRLFQCDFCGTLHATKEEAARHGCDKGELPQKFRVGENVIAPFSLAAGLECLGTEHAEGEVVEIRLPYLRNRQVPVILKLERGTHDQRDTFRSSSPQTAHAWVYIVKPTQPAKSDKGGFLENEAFAESQLTAK